MPKCTAPLSVGWRSSPLPSASQQADKRNVSDSRNIGLQFSSPLSVVPPPTDCMLGLPDQKQPDADEARIWTRFANAGALSECSLREKDRAVLVAGLAALEAELHDYQYNMGLLLLERKSLTTECANLRIAVAEAEEKLSREDEVHARELSDARNRESLLKKALDVERQCSADLERALRAAIEKAGEDQASADRKLAQVDEAIFQAEQKELLAKSKLHSAEAFCAEANRKNAQLETRLHDIEAREGALRRDRQTLDLQLEARTAEVVRQEQSLHKWQKGLQEGQERLLQGERLLNSRECCLSDRDDSLRDAEIDLSDRRKLLEEQQGSLHREEEELKAKVTSERSREQALVEREVKVIQKEQEGLVRQEQLASKEKEFERRDRDLTDTNKQLQALQMTMNIKQEDITKQRKDLNLLSKKLEGEQSKLEEKRKRYEDTAAELQELHCYLETEREACTEERGKIQATVDALEHRSQTISKREQEAAKREAMKEHEKKTEMITKQKQLATESRHVDDRVRSAREDLQKMVDAIEHGKLKIVRQRQKLQRASNIHQQLQDEIEALRAQRQTTVANIQELRAERAKNAKERDALEAKTNKMKLELEVHQEERKSMAIWLQNEGERLKREKQQALAKFQIDIDTLKHEKDQYDLDIARKRSQLLCEQQHDRQDLQTSPQSREQELEWRLEKEREGIRTYYLEMETKLLREVQEEKEQIRASRVTVMQAMREIKLERKALDKERLELLKQKQKLGNDAGVVTSVTEKLRRQMEPAIDEKRDEDDNRCAQDENACTFEDQRGLGDSSLGCRDTEFPTETLVMRTTGPNCPTSDRTGTSTCEVTNIAKSSQKGKQKTLSPEDPDEQKLSILSSDTVGRQALEDNSSGIRRKGIGSKAVVTNTLRKELSDVLDLGEANSKDKEDGKESPPQDVEPSEHLHRKRRRSLEIHLM